MWWWFAALQVAVVSQEVYDEGRDASVPDEGTASDFSGDTTTTALRGDRANQGMWYQSKFI